LWLFITNECVEHGPTEGAVPVVKIVIVLSLRYPFDFEDIPADFTLVHGFAPSCMALLLGLEKEKGGPVMESPLYPLQMNLSG